MAIETSRGPPPRLRVRFAMTPRVPKKLELLHGPYLPPALHRGDRATCQYRDAEVVISSWSDAPISWPRCCLAGSRGGAGLLVTEELVRAIRRESSLAIQYWWGVKAVTVWRWRRAFGVTRLGTEGSRRLHQDKSEAGADKLRGKKRQRAAIQKQMETRRERGYKAPQRWANRMEEMGIGSAGDGTRCGPG